MMTMHKNLAYNCQVSFVKRYSYLFHSYIGGEKKNNYKLTWEDPQVYIFLEWKNEQIYLSFPVVFFCSMYLVCGAIKTQVWCWNLVRATWYLFVTAIPSKRAVWKKGRGFSKILLLSALEIQNGRANVSSSQNSLRGQLGMRHKWVVQDVIFLSNNNGITCWQVYSL